MTVEHDGLVSVFQLREASEHGFADCVLVRVGSGEVVVGAFGAESSSLCSQLSLQDKTTHLRTIRRWYKPPLRGGDVLKNHGETTERALVPQWES